MYLEYTLTGDNGVKNCGLFVLFFRKHYLASFKHKNFCALFEAYEPVSTHEEEKIYISLACSVSQQRVPKHLSRDVEKYRFDVCLKKEKRFAFTFDRNTEHPAKIWHLEGKASSQRDLQKL